MKAISTRLVADAVLELAGGRRRERPSEALLDGLPVVGVHGAERSLVYRLGRAQPRQLGPAIIHPLEAPLPVARPDDLRKRVRELAIVSLPRARLRRRRDAIKLG